MKHIKTKIANTDHTARTRRDIEDMQRILDKFSTEDGFEDYCERNSIKLSVGGDDVDLYFAPRTWEAAENFLMYCICHYIVADDLDEFPLYKDMLTRYSAALGMERGEFDE